MLIIISPAKTLDFQTPIQVSRFSLPDMLSESAKLIKICQQLTPSELASLMKINDKLAGLNVVRFSEWHLNFSLDNARPALPVFKGEVFKGLNAIDFSNEDNDFAQQHLRILSGLHGILKPLDLIQPYRLEMATKLKTKQCNDLYQFWGNKICSHLQKAIDAQGDNILINLASDEYFTATKPSKLRAEIIKPVFLDKKNGQYKILTIYAKKARGLMCRYIIKNRLSKIEQLMEFDLEGYIFDDLNSSSNELIFKRG